MTSVSADVYLRENTKKVYMSYLGKDACVDTSPGVLLNEIGQLQKIEELINSSDITDRGLRYRDRKAKINVFL